MVWKPEKKLLKNIPYFPGRYYIELQNHGIPEELQNIQLATKLAKEMNLPIIATNDAHYAKKNIIKHMMYIYVLVPESIYQIKID